jgi:hypothetical protein
MIKKINLTTLKHEDNHTLAVVESDGYFYYITLLENLPGAPKNHKEFRITHMDGVCKYMTIDEMIGTPFQRLITEVKTLTKRVSEDKIFLQNDGKLLVK